jgi:hypothetical protein
MEYKSLVLPAIDKPLSTDKPLSGFGFLSWTKASVQQDLNPIRTEDQKKLLAKKFTEVTEANFNNETGTYYLHQPKNNGKEIVLLGKFKETNTEGKYWDGPRSYSGATQYVYDKATMPDLENIYMLTGELDDDDRKIMQAIPKPPLPPRRGGNTRRLRRRKRRNKSNKA